MAGLFPVFFKQYWAGGFDASISTFHLGQANSIAAIIGGCFAPFLGYMADKKRARKKFLFFFAAKLNTGKPNFSNLSVVEREQHFPISELQNPAEKKNDTP